MGRRIPHPWKFTVAIVGQTVLLFAGWGFLVLVLIKDPLTVPDYLARLMDWMQTKKAFIVTLLATILSTLSTRYALIKFYGSIAHDGLYYSIFCQPLSRKHCSIVCINQSR